MTVAPNFTNGSDAVVPPITKPKAIENKKLMKRQRENIALFLEDKPIDIEYMDAVIASVASVGLPFVFHASRISGRRGTSM